MPTSIDVIHASGCIQIDVVDGLEHNRHVKVTDLIWLGQRLVDAGEAEVRASAPGVPIAELVVMGDLLDNSPTTITEVAERTGYVQSRVSRTVSNIVQRGWAVTETDPADGRRTVIRIPEHISAEASEFQPGSRQRPFDMLLADVPAQRRRTIVAALEDLLRYLRA